MRQEFRALRINQLTQTLAPLSLGPIPRPSKGWIRAIREVTGVSIRELAMRLRKSPTLVARLEKSEAEYRITLESLRNAAEAMDCRLVYAFVPRQGSLADLAEQDARANATEMVRSVEHSMALEDQAVGRVEELIDQETKRLTRRRRR